MPGGLNQKVSDWMSRVRGNLHARFSGGGRRKALLLPDSRRSVTIAFN